MSTIEQSIDVNVPVRASYDQWTQFEQFPRFMEGVEEVRQIDDTHLRWRTRIAGEQQEFDAEITEQHPDHRIAWRSTPGGEHAGVVTFHSISVEQTRIKLQLDVEHGTIPEKVGAALGLVKHRVKGDLERFKEMMESDDRQNAR